MRSASLIAILILISIRGFTQETEADRALIIEQRIEQIAEAAESDNAVYTLSNDIIIMTGNVLVTQGQTALSSDKLTYNLDTGDGVMEGNVKTILQQGSN